MNLQKIEDKEQPRKKNFTLYSLRERNNLSFRPAVLLGQRLFLDSYFDRLLCSE